MISGGCACELGAQGIFVLECSVRTHVQLLVLSQWSATAVCAVGVQQCGDASHDGVRSDLDVGWFRLLGRAVVLGRGGLRHCLWGGAFDMTHYSACQILIATCTRAGLAACSPVPSNIRAEAEPYSSRIQ